MSPRTARSLDIVAAIAAAEAGIVTAQQLVDGGVSRSTTHYRIRSGGPWSRLLLGVYLVSGGRPDRHLQRVAALLYAGPSAALTGIDALELHAVWRAPLSTANSVHVLIPKSTRRSLAGFVVAERTTRPPGGVVLAGMNVAPVPRALVDAGRRVRRASDVTALVARGVQGGFTTVDEVNREIRAAHRRSTALLRDTLLHLRAGVRSAPEAALRELPLLA